MGKNYLNSSSFIDGFLKITHPDNLRKNDVKNICKLLMKKIIKVIMEITQMYSLNFWDDEDENENESSYISKIDSKQI